MSLQIISGYKSADLAMRYGKMRSNAGYGTVINIGFCAGCTGWAYYTPGDGKYLVPGGYFVTENENMCMKREAKKMNDKTYKIVIEYEIEAESEKEAQVQAGKTANYVSGCVLDVQEVEK